MKKFGFGKKSDDAAATAGRKPESPPPAYNANPYAAQPVDDDPYAGQKYANMPGLPSGPRAGGLPSGPGPRNSPGPRGGPPPRGANPYADSGASAYGSGDNYGSRNGYGASSGYANANTNAYAATSNYSTGSSASTKASQPFSSGSNQPSSGSSAPSSGYGNQKYGTYGKGAGAYVGTGPTERKAYNQDAYAANQQTSAQPLGANRKDYNQNAYTSNQQIRPSSPPRAGPRRAGGYGGLGSDDGPDANKDALFSDVKDRRGQGEAYRDYRNDGPQATGGYGRKYDDDANRNDLLGGAQNRYDNRQQTTGDPYGGYGADRELTEEEQEKMMLRGLKGQIVDEKKGMVKTGERILGKMDETEQRGLEMLANLGIQGDRLHNTELHLDLAANQNKRAEQETRTLKALNRSMFRPVAGNPFTSKKRLEAEREKMMEQHHLERDRAAATRKERYDAGTAMDKTWRGLNDVQPIKAAARNPADRSKYMFHDEDDDEATIAADEALEDEIDAAEDMMLQKAGRINYIARALGTVVDEQNRMIDRIAEKSDAVDDQVRMNRDALSRIK